MTTLHDGRRVFTIPKNYFSNFNFVVPEEKSSLVDIDPKQFCGFNPCDISKCLLAPLGSCVSDYKCRPVFFDENNKRIESCVGKIPIYF